jgi:hypothetical protein
MNGKLSMLWPVTARTIGTALCLLSLGGCFGGYQLVAFNAATTISGWHQYVTPRAPLNPVEKNVIEVARTKEDKNGEEQDIFFIINDNSKEKMVQVVDVVSKTESKDPFPERTVIRYRIIDGMVAAMSDPSEEFYVNADLERAVFRAIAITWSSDRVLIYNDGLRSMSIVSHAVNKCTTDVKIYTGGVVGGVPIAEKRVAFCFVR